MKKISIVKFDEIFNDILNKIISDEILNLVGDEHKYSYKAQKDRMNISIGGNSIMSVEIPLEIICKFYNKRNYEVVKFEDAEALMMW